MAGHSNAFLQLVDDARRRIEEIDASDMPAVLAANPDAALIDTREQNEFAAGHLKGAVWLGKGIIERGIEGLVPLSELSYDRIDDPRQIVKEGQIVKAEIVDVNPSDRRITLSLKKAELENLEAMKFDENRGANRDGAPARKVGPSGGGGATLGDVLKDKLGGLSVSASEAPAAEEASEEADASDEEE